MTELRAANQPPLSPPFGMPVPEPLGVLLVEDEPDVLDPIEERHRVTRKGLPRDVAASVRQRLLDLARAGREDFNLVLLRYPIERLLYRLSVSEHASRSLLKGAMLFAV